MTAQIRGKLRQRQPTMRQIARKAGVSPTTVAHVLNQTEGTYVAEKTRDKVVRASKSLGYQTSLLSRSIKDPLHHLGIAIAETAPQANAVDIAELCSGIQVEATRHGYMSVVQMMNVADAREGARNAVESMSELYRAKLIDGFILDKSCFVNAAVHELARRHVPILTLNGITVFEQETHRPIPAVNIDNYEGGRLAMRHLLELGHRRIGFISRPYTHYPRYYQPYQVKQIVHAGKAALQEAGCPMEPGWFVEGDPFDRQTTYQAVHSLFSGQSKPTALFVADDAMAVMACHALAKLNLRVPDDVSIVGYGGWSQAGRLAEPSLTTIHAPLRHNGALAAWHMIALLEGSEPSEHHWIRPELQPGESTSPL